jgi:hypothetical protein
MGCSSSLCGKELDNSLQEIENFKRESKENKGTAKKNKSKDKKKEDSKKEKSKENKKSNKKEEKDKFFKDINDKKQNKKIIIDKVRKKEEEDNKETISNLMTEGLTNEANKFQKNRDPSNGVIIMKGIREYISEDLDEDDILIMVEEALGENINFEDEEEIPGTITYNQAKAIASLLYAKINKKDDDEDEKDGEIDIKRYPELKGVNVKIGVGDLTKDVVRNMMFRGQKVDECQIDLTYANLTKGENNFKALTIEIL